MTMIKDGCWYLQRQVCRYAVQWRLSPGNFVTFTPDQYVRVRSMIWPAGVDVIPNLFSEVRRLALEAHKASERSRYGTRLSGARADLCEDIAERLNAAGIKPV